MKLIQLQTRTPNRWLRLFRSPRAIRHGVMLFFFLFLLRIAWEHQVVGGGPNGSPSVEAYCPFGGIETLYQFATTGGFVRHIEPSAMILLAALVVLSLLFSRGFCGWICPFGSLQEWIGLLGRGIFGNQYNPTGVCDRRLRSLKYVVLIAIVGFTWYLGTLVFRPVDPFLAFFHLGNGFNEMPWAYALLIVVLVASLRYERSFCKYVCPLGAAISIISKVGITRIERHTEGCKECNACHKACFANVDFLSATSIRDSDCNHCLDCVTTCPKPNVLTARGGVWRFSHTTYATLLVAGLVGTIGVSKLAGSWRTKPESVAFTDPAGKLDADQMRGWMTLNDISSGYGIPLDSLYQHSNLPAKVPSSTRVNQIARAYNLDLEPEQVREVVRAFLSGQSGKLSDGKKTRNGHPGEEEVKGFMTLNEIVLKTGVPKDFILKELGVPAETDPRRPLREWMHANGKSIQDVRAAVAAYRAAKKPSR